MDNTTTHSLPNGLDEDQYIQQLLNEAQARLQSSSPADNSLTSITESGVSAQDIPKYAFLCTRTFSQPYTNNWAEEYPNCQLVLLSNPSSSRITRLRLLTTCKPPHPPFLILPRSQCLVQPNFQAKKRYVYDFSIFFILASLL